MAARVKLPHKGTLVQQLSHFSVTAKFSDISDKAVRELKIRVLDALGCAIGALDGEPVRILRTQVDEFGGNELCTLIGGGKTAPDLAAFYNGALVRYLDFNDGYLAKGETCHPSDNVAAILAGAEYVDATGRDFLTGLAVAYEIQCRLSDVAPVRSRGFDHTVQGSYAVAAGVSKVLGLDEKKTANAVAISGTALNALRVSRTGEISNWKGFAYPFMTFAATQAIFLAMKGITGPLEVFEGNKGFMDSIAGRFTIDWSKEDLERVTKTILKKYNAEVHSQSSIEGILEIMQEQSFKAADIEKIEVEIFNVAYNIIGGGEEGEKITVKTKEEADHSLPYIIAAAILDGTVMPHQYYQERILKLDVQQLLRKIRVCPREDYSRRFPNEMPVHLIVHLKDGSVIEKEKRDYEGFFTRPLSWEGAVYKFTSLSSTYASQSLQKNIVNTINHLDKLHVSDLTKLLMQVHGAKRAKT